MCSFDAKNIENLKLTVSNASYLYFVQELAS
jgi:hypothetical protein